MTRLATVEIEIAEDGSVTSSDVSWEGNKDIPTLFIGIHKAMDQITEDLAAEGKL